MTHITYLTAFLNLALNNFLFTLSSSPDSSSSSPSSSPSSSHKVRFYRFTTPESVTIDCLLVLPLLTFIITIIEGISAKSNWNINLNLFAMPSTSSPDV